jgi:hypothetical protein
MCGAVVGLDRSRPGGARPQGPGDEARQAGDDEPKVLGRIGDRNRGRGCMTAFSEWFSGIRRGVASKPSASQGEGVSSFGSADVIESRSRYEQAGWLGDDEADRSGIHPRC